MNKNYKTENVDSHSFFENILFFVENRGLLSNSDIENLIIKIGEINGDDLLKEKLMLSLLRFEIAYNRKEDLTTYINTIYDDLYKAKKDFSNFKWPYYMYVHFYRIIQDYNFDNNIIFSHEKKLNVLNVCKKIVDKQDENSSLLRLYRISLDNEISYIRDIYLEGRQFIDENYIERGFWSRLISGETIRFSAVPEIVDYYFQFEFKNLEEKYSNTRDLERSFLSEEGFLGFFFRKLDENLKYYSKNWLDFNSKNYFDRAGFEFSISLTERSRLNPLRLVGSKYDIDEAKKQILQQVRHANFNIILNRYWDDKYGFLNKF